LSKAWQIPHAAVIANHHFYHFLFMVNVIRQMVPLFSKVDSIKLWNAVQNEESVICTKFGKDLQYFLSYRP